MPSTRKSFRSPKTFSGKSFKGILLEPMSVPFVPTGLELDGTKQKEIVQLLNSVVADANRQLFARIEALADHYGVSSDDNPTVFYAKLVRMLANDFLPGFLLNAHRTARKKGSYTTGGNALFEAVNQRISTTSCSVKDACVYLSRHSNPWKRHPPPSLEAAYHRFRSDCIDAYQTMVADAHYGPLIELVGLERLFETMNNSQEK